ncbi:hypothetical protein CFAM422_003190 [Trichoderma lentiforme]|uniref:Zn(2)-C6 fungal-type domain-containing protein n=1 Tax=Trichoderma lentiforme TaxID=1567552 RepID=A0A9P5CGJ1_9HYPO|nr:hypothetical protein CFAM422_003190 [Trichoderma lentiforme]
MSQDDYGYYSTLTLDGPTIGARDDPLSSPKTSNPQIATEKPKQRRKRVTLACDSCRDRKTRCDGVRPICGPCKRRKKASCDFQEDTLKPSRYASKLERRITALEEQSSKANMSVRDVELTHKEASKGQRTPNELDQCKLQPNDSPVNSVSRTSAGSESVISDLTSTRRTAKPKRQWSTASERRASQNMDAMVAIPFSANSRDGYYGNSSSVAFLNWVGKSAQTSASCGELLPEPAHLSQPSHGYDLEEPRHIDAADFDLPQRRVADSLVQTFFQLVHPLYPLLHQPTFMASYEQLWTSSYNPVDSAIGSDIQDSIFHAMLNLVFAMGCPFSTAIPPQDRSSRASKFFRRAQGALSFNVLEADSLPLVQFLLLTSLYLQSTSHAHRCWNTVGLAIRAAQGLGLHIDDESSPCPPSRLETEMKRRIWHICVTLDRVLAMTFGRPTMTSHKWTVQVPELIDDEYLTEVNHHSSSSGLQPATVTPRIGCFVYTLKLFSIMDDILSAFYNVPDGMESTNKSSERQLPDLDFTSMVELDRRLNEFEAALPSWLTPSGCETTPDATQRDCNALQVNVLRARFLHTRLLLLRPVLLAYVQKCAVERTNPTSTGISGFDQQFYLYGSNRCIATSHDIISHLHANITSLAQPAPWYVVYFTLTAATTLFAARLRSRISVDSPAATFDTSWERCTNILNHLKGLTQSAAQGIAVLQSLYQRVSASSAGGIDVFDDQPVERLDAGEPPVSSAFYINDDHVSSILRNPLTGEDWFRNTSLNLDWLELELEDSIN